MTAGRELSQRQRLITDPLSYVQSGSSPAAKITVGLCVSDRDCRPEADNDDE